MQEAQIFDVGDLADLQEADDVAAFVEPVGDGGAGLHGADVGLVRLEEVVEVVLLRWDEGDEVRLEEDGAQPSLGVAPEPAAGLFEPGGR